MGRIQFHFTLKRNTIAFVAIFFGNLVLAVAVRAQDNTLIFDDGQQHVLSEAADRVLVTNESRLELRASVPVVEVDNATAVQVSGRMNGVPGSERGLTLRNGASAVLQSASINGIEVDGATLVLEDGRIDHWDCDTIRVRNGSTVSLNGGGVGSADPSCQALDVMDSIVEIDGARVFGIKNFRGSSSLVINAGEVDNIDSQNIIATDTATLTVTGGNISAAHDVAIELSNTATLHMTGGEIQSGVAAIRGVGDAVAEIWGGNLIANEFGPVVSMGGASQLNIAGGGMEIAIDESGEYPHISAVGGATVTLFGSDFNYPLSESIQDSNGEITGTLADGSAISWRFRRTAGATVMLLPFVTGDYSLNGGLDAADLDQQSTAMRTPTKNLAKFDENADGSVDSADRAIWVKDLAMTFFGDANLDGEFDSTDLVAVFTAGMYETDRAAGWAEGDWDGDGVFRSADLVLALQDGGYGQGPQQVVAPVPEPTSLLPVVGVVVAILGRVRRPACA